MTSGVIGEVVYDTYADLLRTAERLEQRHADAARAVETLDALVDHLKEETHQTTLAKTTLELLLQTITEENLRAVEKLVTYGLRTVFADRALSLHADATVKRGAPWVDLTLAHGAVEAPVLDAFGGGPGTVVAFLLRLLVLRRLGLAPVLLLDETFSHVSTKGGYAMATGQLLREIADKLGVTILLVTHQPELLAHATHAYEIREGSHGSTFVKLAPEDR